MIWYGETIPGYMYLYFLQDCWQPDYIIPGYFVKKDHALVGKHRWRLWQPCWDCFRLAIMQTGRLI